jgi:hypothetical protein
MPMAASASATPASQSVAGTPADKRFGNGRSDTSKSTSRMSTKPGQLQTSVSPTVIWFPGGPMPSEDLFLRKADHLILGVARRPAGAMDTRLPSHWGLHGRLRLSAWEAGSLGDHADESPSLASLEHPRRIAFRPGLSFQPPSAPCEGCESTGGLDVSIGTHLLCGLESDRKEAVFPARKGRFPDRKWFRRTRRSGFAEQNAALSVHWSAEGRI